MIKIILFLGAVACLYGQTITPPFNGNGGGGVTVCPGSSTGTANAVLTDTGSGACQDSLATVDLSGNLNTHGNITSGGGGTVAGQIHVSQGTAPTIPANSFGFQGPSAITTSLFLCPPNANPTVNQVMLFPAPTSNVSCWTWAAPITLTTTGTSGAASYTPSTNTLNIPTPSAPTVIHSPGGYFNGGGSALTTSVSPVYLAVPYACTILGYNILVDTGTASFDVWKIASGTAIPTVSNTIISGTSYLAIVTGTALISSTTSAFTTTTVTANDIFGFKLHAVSGSPTQASIQVVCQ